MCNYNPENSPKLLFHLCCPPLIQACPIDILHRTGIGTKSSRSQLKSYSSETWSKAVVPSCVLIAISKVAC